MARLALARRRIAVFGEPILSVLEPWRWLAAAPQTLTFGKMTLIASDFGEPVVTGSGEIRCPSPSRFEYTLTGTPDDPVYAYAQTLRHKTDPYDGRLRLRLLVEDDEGRSYNAGWTTPRIRQGGTGDTEWVVEGECQGLMTGDAIAPPSAGGGTEVEFLIPRHHRASLFLNRFVRTPLADGGFEPVYRLSVLDTHVTFRFDAARDVLNVSAPGNGALLRPFTENWLGEPLRILFGQLVYPRLIARISEDGRATITQRPSPSWSSVSDWAALWDREDLLDEAGFWSLYQDLLTYVAGAKDDRGGPNFESNTVTRLYEEVIQAARGSRWVWALTFASSVEGLVRILTPHGTKRPDAHTKGIEALARHIGEWPGNSAQDKHLRGVAVSAVHRTAETTSKYVLDQLALRNVITTDQIKSWSKVRNSVMHGSLVSPYSSAEDDKLLLDLAALMKALTVEIVRPSGPAQPPAPALSA